MKTHLTPLDLMRLDAARDKDGALPTVHQYNLAIKQRKLLGHGIIPVGTKNSLFHEEPLPQHGDAS